MTIGQVSKAAGIAASAIRYYDSGGVLPAPQRKNGVRHYDASAVDQLKILCQCNGDTKKCVIFV